MFGLSVAETRWRQRLEAAGYRVLWEPWAPAPAPRPLPPSAVAPPAVR